MANIVRKNDADSSGDVATPANFSPDVLVAGQNVFRHGDLDTNNDVVSAGLGLTAKVFINNKAVVVADDVDSAGDIKIAPDTKVSVG